MTPQSKSDDKSGASAADLKKAIDAEIKDGGIILVQKGSVVLPLKDLHQDEHAEVKTDFPANQ